MCEVRSGKDGKRTLAAYAAVFNRYSQNLGGYVEQVDPAAFTRTLQSADVMCLVGHETDQVLGRVSAGTLRLEVDNIGLRYEVDLPDTTTGRDLAENVALRNITGSSFGFRVTRDGDSWGSTDQGFALRTLHDVELYDVGPGVWPAYLDTEADGNAVAFRTLAARSGVDLEIVVDAAAANELRSIIDPPREPKGPVDATPTDLTVLRRRLELDEHEMALRLNVGR